MQIVRHSVQVLIVLLIIIIGYLNYYGVVIEQRNDTAIERSIPLSLFHKFFAGKERSEVIETTHKVKGSVWTVDIYGFKMSDPLAAVESTVLSLSFYGPLLLSILIPVILTVLLGRFFCGWLCPMHLLLELNDKIRKLLSKFGYNTRDIPFSRNAKFVVLVIGLVIAFFMGLPLLSLIYPPAVISREIIYKIYRGFWGTGLLMLGTICFIELILSRRWWCKYICPGGAIYCLLSKFKILGIKRNDDNCTQCGKCDPVCPYDLKPMTKELRTECDQCGLCIAACEFSALDRTITIPNAKKNG